MPDHEWTLEVVVPQWHGPDKRTTYLYESQTQARHAAAAFIAMHSTPDSLAPESVKVTGPRSK